MSRVITSAHDFDTLLAGYTAIRAVSYVVSPELLLRFFDAGVDKVEVVVGESITGQSHDLVEQYRDSLRQKDRPAIERLADLVTAGRLKILVPNRTIHSKLFILENNDRYRVIQGSANLTETARRATRQVNYIWYADLDADDPWLAQVCSDYAAHRKDCIEFMGDLAELLRQRETVEKEAIIEAWLKGAAGEEEELESKRFLRDITTRAFEAAGAPNDPIFTQSLPKAPKARRPIERMLAPLNLPSTDHRLSLDAHIYLQHIEQAHSVPLMQVDLGQNSVRLAMAGEVVNRNALPDDPTSLNQALAHIEGYLATVDGGQSLDPVFAKASMFEALLYFLAAPFAHEHMRARRRAYALVDSRGPQVLYLFGRAQNGKSTFVRFALKLLSGRNVTALPGAHFTKTRVLTASSLGTVFPLVFDDVDVAHKGSIFEQVLKSYWEVWWRDDCPVPQLVLTSNAENLKEWAKSRIKRIDFDVHFSPTPNQKSALNKILETENPLFPWFAALYLSRLRDGDVPSEDELETARGVLKDLYQRADRPLPDFFPERPIEEMYDPGRRSWRDLLYGLRKASVDRRDHRLIVSFTDDMQYSEVRAAVGHLPQNVKHEVKGKTIIIESPAEFRSWLGVDRNGDTNWIQRFWKSLSRG